MEYKFINYTEQDYTNLLKVVNHFDIIMFFLYFLPKTTFFT
jgi:hypothetical protein